MSQLPDGLSPDAVQAAVRERYSGVAAEPARDFGFPVGRAFAEAVGYAPELLAALPAEAAEAFAGVACPVPRAELHPGETVVDLGCGAGLDSLLAARAVGETGHVIGVDFAPQMVERARRVANVARMPQVEIRLADGCALPLADESADAVLVNGIFNLNPDKTALLREAGRVLRPGGRLVAAEIILTAPLPEGEGHSLDDWFR
ncbi:MAG TPA: methyltransferase domain-containing protein [Dehalococcoidia bacterium]|nr:methyltransferase domain-containing protein [Dehalococcoidia bacterium]